MTTIQHPASSTKRYPSGSLIAKLKKRGIIGALAAIIGTGWLVYEIVYYILVEHYHLPENLKDISIVSTVCVLLCSLTWRWFRGEKRRGRIKWEAVLIPAFILAGAFLNGRYLFRLGEKGEEHGPASVKETAWKNSLAVLPFVNMSTDPEQEYFCDGLTEELITKMSQIRELKVPARTSAFAFKGKSADVREIGRKLAVANVLEGSVRKSSSRIRITAQLISAADGYHLWSETYDRELADIFAVQDEIARSVARTLQVTLLKTKGAIPETKNSQAYNALLMGQYFYRQQTRESLEKAIGYYEQAIRLDPGYAVAWEGLAASYAFQAGVGYTSPKTGYDQARAAVKKALELDKNLAYAHRIMGYIQMSYDWDWAAAGASYQVAMSLDPGKGQVEAAQLAVAMGRFDDAVALARRTVELDPINVQSYATLALAHWYGGWPDEAVTDYQKILEIIPEYSAITGLIGWVRLTQSKPQEALAVLDQTKDPMWRLPGMAMYYHTQGRTAESDSALAEFIEKYHAGSAYNIAQVYAYRGEADRAFEWLDKAYSQHDGGMFLVKVDPFFKDLRTDPRFRALLIKLRLPA